MHHTHEKQNGRSGRDLLQAETDLQTPADYCTEKAREELPLQRPQTKATHSSPAHDSENDS